MVVPRFSQPDQITVGVQGPVDPASVTPFVLHEKSGSVVVIDLTAAAGGDLVSGLPRVDAVYADGNIVITGQAKFPVGHVMGLFCTNVIHDAPGDTGRALVPSPVSKLLTLRGPLVDANGRSTLLTVPDSDAAMLETGRLQLAMLFDDPPLPKLIGISRQPLLYCYAFPVAPQPC